MLILTSRNLHETRAPTNNKLQLQTLFMFFAYQENFNFYFNSTLYHLYAFVLMFLKKMLPFTLILHYTISVPLC
jgi:hypothetical protein